MGRTDGTETKTCGTCGETSEEFYYLLNHSPVCHKEIAELKSPQAAIEVIRKELRKKSPSGPDGEIGSYEEDLNNIAGWIGPLHLCKNCGRHHWDGPKDCESV